MKNLYQKTFVLVLLLTSSVAVAQKNVILGYADIKKAVKSFVVQQQVPLQNIQVKITSLSEQVRLKPCRQPLHVSMAPGTKLMGNTSLAITCPSSSNWKIHVAAHIDGFVNTLIARHPIPRGTVINNADLEYRLSRYSQLNHGYYATADQLQNMVASRNIKTGQVINPRIIKAQKLVLRGQHVTIIAQRGSLNLSVKGKALMDGRQGQTIKVRNLSSKKLIYAQVISLGIVKVNF